MRKLIVGALLCVIALIGSSAEAQEYLEYNDFQLATLEIDSLGSDSSLSSGTMSIGLTYGFTYMNAQIVIGDMLAKTHGAGAADSGEIILRSNFAGTITVLGTANTVRGAFPCTLSVELPGAGCLNGTSDSILRPSRLEVAWSVQDTIVNDTLPASTPTYDYPIYYKIFLKR